MAESRSSWQRPAESAFRTGLKLRNSFTKEKEEFFTQSGDQRLYWYMCGPTVYNHSHLGHARAYLTFDILRKVLESYFGYKVTLVMNITDIDDKIIINSKEAGQTLDEFGHYWEAQFFDDMQKLEIAQPDILTRVTEYVPEIVVFIEKIISNGYAYSSNGSVYFDTTAFRASHQYCKLEPSALNDTERLQEAEGALSDIRAQEKRCVADFALWKKSKEGEPSWESPWGAGRPGWHIECSVMASDNLPCPLDLHSGGIDLAFPHHDNELAQSEAYYDCQQWVNYFVHAGHLHIDSRRMARSLKNFITIKEALKTYTAKQIRMMFVLHKYDTMMNYSVGALEEAKERERQVGEFVLHARAALRAHQISEKQKLKQEDKDLLAEFRTRQTQIHAALCDNISTDAAMDIITDIICKANAYMQRADFKALPLNAIYKYVVWIMSVFGLNYEGSGESRSSEEVVGPVANAVMAFRERVRAAAREGNTKAVLEACDQVRDVDLLRAGVRIEDKPTGPVWVLLDPAAVEAEMRAKAEAEQAKSEAKEKARIEREAQEEVKRKKAMVSPGDMFRGDKYSAWDERGLPTHDAAGQELSKSAKKSVQKEFEKQEKLHAKYLESLSKPAS